MKSNILTSAVLLLSLGWAVAVHAEDPQHVQQLLTTKACPNCDLSGVNFTGTDLSEANLQGANLNDANLSGVVLTAADLSGATLMRANLSNALLNGANLSGANFQSANLQNATLYGIKAREAFNLTGANLQGTIMPSGRVNPTTEEEKKLSR